RLPGRAPRRPVRRLLPRGHAGPAPRHDRRRTHPRRRHPRRDGRRAVLAHPAAAGRARRRGLPLMSTVTGPSPAPTQAPPPPPPGSGAGVVLPVGLLLARRGSARSAVLL